MVKKIVEIGDKWGRIWRVYILYACFCYFVFTFDNIQGVLYGTLVVELLLKYAWFQ